jgi:hypothetical protein
LSELTGETEAANDAGDGDSDEHVNRHSDSAELPDIGK